MLFRKSRKQFESLVLKEVDALYRLAFRLTGNRSTAEDLTQETLLRAYKAFDRVKIEQFGLKGWGKIARSGETSHTGATVQHLHYHLIQPKPGLDGKALPVNFPIG